MNITGKVSVTIDWEQESEIIREIVRADYNRLLNDCVELMAKDDLEDFQKEDLMNNLESMKGFLKTLEFYSVHEDHQAWLNKFYSDITPELKEKIGA